MKTPKQVAAEIAKRNKAFRSATKSEKRVLIAKDVLTQLKARTIDAATGVWVSLTQIPDYGDVSLQKCVLDGTAKCRTCALGSILLSLALFKNNVTVDDAYSGVLSYDGIVDGSQDDVLGLTTLFSTQQRILIEQAFECGGGFYSGRSIKGEDFGLKYGEPHSRLSAIMRNIVKNNGTFIP